MGLKRHLYDLPASAVFAPSQIEQLPTITASQNNWLPTNFHSKTLFLFNNNGSNWDITGLDAPPAGTNPIKYFANTGAGGGGTLRFKNNDAASLAANRMIFKADLSVEDFETLAIFYDSVNARWRPLSQIT